MSKNLSEPIRSHKDLDKDSAPHFHKAVKFYEGLSKQLVHQGHVLDLFACALDQVICTIDMSTLFLIFQGALAGEYFANAMDVHGVGTYNFSDGNISY